MEKEKSDYEGLIFIEIALVAILLILFLTAVIIYFK